MDSIVHPLTNEKFSIFSNNGKLLLKSYIKNYQNLIYQIGSAYVNGIIGFTCLPKSIVFFSSGHIDIGDGNIRNIVLMGERHDLTDQYENGCLILHKFVEELMNQFKKHSQCLDFYVEVDPTNTLTDMLENKTKLPYNFHESILSKIKYFRDNYKENLRLHGFDLRIMSGKLSKLYELISLINNFDHNNDIVKMYINIIKNALDFNTDFVLNRNDIQKIVDIINSKDTISILEDHIGNQMHANIELPADFFTLHTTDEIMGDLTIRLEYIRTKTKKEYDKLPDQIKVLTPSKIYEITKHKHHYLIETDIYTIYRLLMQFDNTSNKESRKGNCEYFSKNCLIWGGGAHTENYFDILSYLIKEGIINGQLSKSLNLMENNNKIINIEYHNKFIDFQELVGFYGLSSMPSLKLVKSDDVPEEPVEGPVVEDMLGDNIKIYDDIFTLNTPLGTNIIFYSCDREERFQKSHSQIVDSIYKAMENYSNVSLEFHTDILISFNGIIDLMLETVPEEAKNEPTFKTQFEVLNKQVEESQLTSKIDIKIVKSIDELENNDNYNDKMFIFTDLHNSTDPDLQKTIKQFEQNMNNENISNSIKSILKSHNTRYMALRYHILSLQNKNIVYFVDREFINKFYNLFNMTNQHLFEYFNFTKHRVSNSSSIDYNSLIQFFQLKKPELVPLYDNQYIEDYKIKIRMLHL
jgi:hypothetical protein